MSLNSFPNPGAAQWGPLSEAILRELGLGQYLGVPPLKLTMIVDKVDQSQAVDLMKRTTLAHNRFMELRPVVVRPRPLEQRFLDVETIHQAAIIEHENAENTGSSLLVILCRTEPVDLVFGVGEHGEGLVSDLRRGAAKWYPNQAQKFVTQTEIQRAARERPFASEPDAFLLVVFERLYKTKIVTRPSGV